MSADGRRGGGRAVSAFGILLLAIRRAEPLRKKT